MDKTSFKKYFKDKKKHHRAEYVAVIIVNIIIWYIANNLLNWNLSFIDKSFADVLGIFNLFIIVSIIINFLFIFYHPGWFRNTLKIIIDILSFYVAYVFLMVFPFNLNPLFALILKILIILAMIGTVISIIVHIVKLVLYVTNKTDK